MELRSAQTLAEKLMADHGLTGWRFEWDSSRRRFGLCSYGPKTISLSRHLVLVNHEARVTNTILHEIAHALLPVGEHHGPAWVRKAREIGCDGLRCYNDETTVAPWMPITGTCPNCKRTVGRVRAPRRGNACTPCCKAFNRNRYDSRFNFTWSRTPRPGWNPTPCDARTGCHRHARKHARFRGAETTDTLRTVESAQARQGCRDGSLMTIFRSRN